MPPFSIREASVLGVAALMLVALSSASVIAEHDPETGAAPAAAPAAPAARPRVRVAANNVEEIDIRDCLTKAVEATNAENLDDFCSCFTAPTRSRLRKQVAMRFVEHDVTMELLDTQVIAVGKTSGEVAVKYRLVLTDDRFDVVSLVAVKQEHGYWRISSEKIQSYEHQSPVQCSPSRYACLGAACRVAAR